MSLSPEVEAKCCFLCGAAPDNLEICSHCSLVWSCGVDHYEVHRQKGKCFPFVIKRSETKGRYMVAARDIAPLEMLLMEHPAVVGPYSKTSVGCLQCFRKVDGSYRCDGCGFPVCDEKCSRGELHRPECSFFRERDKTLMENGAPTRARVDSSHVCITPLRMLLKRDNDPKTFARINMLMDHIEARSSGGITSNSSVTQQLFKVVLMLREACCMQEFSYQEIQRMIGILKTNGMKLESHGERGCPGVALYPIYCLINHACYNNTNYVKFPDLHLELRSQLPIKKGEEILTRYISSTIGNVRRREDIQKHWFFDCKCARCRDPTEMGTFMSAVRCLSCQSGFLLPNDSLSYNSDWVCDNCGTIVKHDTVDDVISTIEKQIGAIEHGEISELEEMLFHYQKLLHPNHYILVDLMHNLVHLYASKDSLSRPEKERKIQLCLIVVEALGKVDPGFTKWRGTLLQEMIHSLMMVSKEDHKTGSITEKEFQRRLVYCGRRLREARLCLYGGFTPLDQYIKDKKKQEEEEMKNNKICDS